MTVAEAPAVPARKIPRIALYSHDAMGLGHMRRNSLIAQALARAPLSGAVLLVSGAKELNALDLAPGIDCVTLPALTKDPSGDYRSRNLAISRDDLIKIRSRTIEAALETFSPDLFIVDKLPRGAFCELDGALTKLRRAGTRCVLGLRDILDDPATVRREWEAANAEETLAKYYDAMWVYGDPTVYDPLTEYRFSNDTAERVRFTGYLDSRTRHSGKPDEQAAAALASLEGRRLILCQAGGGQDGEELLTAFADSKIPDDCVGVIVSGPFMPRVTREKLAAKAARSRNLRLITFSSEPAHLVQRADRIIAMGGYNTVCEVLSMEKSALIVPRVRPRVEQLIRAERLRDLGAVSVMTPDAATPEAIAKWLADDVPPPRRIRERIDFNGFERIPHLAEELLAVA